MPIITKEHLFSTYVKEALDVLKEDMEEQQADHETLDAYAWDNLNVLGAAFYHIIGQYYGDLDDAMQDVSE